MSSYVNAENMLKKAFEGKYAVGQFNTNNLEWTKTILQVCEEMKSPVIVGASEGAIKYMGGYNVVANIVKSLINDMNITVPVALHLDHGSSYEACEKAIVAGFTSVMIDKSAASLDENIKESQRVIELAKQYNVSVETEVGSIGGEEDGVIGGVMYARFEDCERMINEAAPTFFAPALGSVHGHYKGEPKLGFEEMGRIADAFHVPLVLHGGSGIPDAMIKKAISLGIAKINVNTEFQESFTKGVRHYIEENHDKDPKGFDPRKVLKPAFEEMAKTVKEKILLFGSDNKA